MKKPPHYVIDARHYLDENGLVPDNIPALAKKFISFLGQIMEEASMMPPGEDIETSMKCRRRPAGNPVKGKSWLPGKLMKPLFCGNVLIVEQGGRLISGKGPSGIIRWVRCIRVKVRF